MESTQTSHEDGTDKIRFKRTSDGSIEVHVGNQKIDTIKPAIWASIVLNLTHFGERPNDWNWFMGHHQGTQDVRGNDMVDFRLGATAMRDMLATFVEQGPDSPAKVIAHSMRLNWNPNWGEDPRANTY